MADLNPRAALQAQMSTTAIAAIVTGIGVVLLCLLVTVVLLLIRAMRTHKQLLADLEERGLTIAQVQRKDEVVSRPQAALRRNTILPFNRTSVWGTLPSVETFRSVESVTAPGHYVPTKPTEDTKRTNRLSWPFSTRRFSGHAIQMKRMQASRLSTVIEDTKPSSLVPILSSSYLSGNRHSITVLREPGSRPSSSQSLLQHHPAFRTRGPDMSPIKPETRIITGPLPHSGSKTRLQRAKSVAEAPSSHVTRPQLRARSASLCSQTSGTAPDVILPPLPLDIARIKSEVKRRSQMRQPPSKLSSSSIGSVDTTILTSRMSPIAPPSTKFRGQKITKPNAKGIAIGTPRPFRDTLDLRARVLNTRTSTHSSTTRESTTSLEQHDTAFDSKTTLSANSSILSLGTVTKAQSVTLSKVSSPNGSPITIRSMTTPKRKMKTQISSTGSPERPLQGSATRPIRSPKRRYSQTSSRSSGGNPFYWDPTPLSSPGKPSALKGSPGARKGHRRKNSVRISLVPTFHGPPSRTPSPSMVSSRPRSFADGASDQSNITFGLRVSGTRSLPTPPSSSTFAPDVKFTATSLQASLTPSSPTLPLVNYDQTCVVFPTDQVLPQLSETEGNRLSAGSVFCLSQFPAAPSMIEPADVNMARPLTFPPSQSYELKRLFQLPSTPLLQQYPFSVQTPQHSPSPSQSSLINVDEYDPENPRCIYQTPQNAVSRNFQSDFAAIPEESSANSNKTVDMEHSRYDDSPPLSPKSTVPSGFTPEDRAAYNLPIHATSIPEEPLDTIDPTILGKDTFTLLNSSIGNLNTKTPASSRPTHSMLRPLLDTSFPSSPPSNFTADSPTIGYSCPETQCSSLYSSPSPSPSPSSSPLALPSPMYLSSPRPSHACLPPPPPYLSINFASLPNLAPSPRGPRVTPSKPLRTSIVALRRMNSDAAEAKRQKGGKGERRYLRLGREDSLPLPGEESWLDELEDSDVEREVDDKAGAQLVESALPEFQTEDEGYTVLDLEEKEPIPFAQTTKNSTLSAVEKQRNRSRSIWNDGEKFWTKTTLSLLPSLCTAPPTTTTTTTTNSPATATATASTRKRPFTIAKDPSPFFPTPSSPTENPPTSPTHKRNSSRSSQRYRKRSVLGVVGTPNAHVRIQVTGPNGVVVGRGSGTPGSLYDGQGFLRF